MFFQKKSHPDEENVAKKSMRKVDTIVTGLILWGIVASIYWVKKLWEKSHHNDTPPHEDTHKTPQVPHFEKKQWIFSRIFFGNK